MKHLIFELNENNYHENWLIYIQELYNLKSEELLLSYKSFLQSLYGDLRGRVG